MSDSCIGHPTILNFQLLQNCFNSYYRIRRYISVFPTLRHNKKQPNCSRGSCCQQCILLDVYFSVSFSKSQKLFQGCCSNKACELSEPLTPVSSHGPCDSYNWPGFFFSSGLGGEAQNLMCVLYTNLTGPLVKLFSNSHFPIMPISSCICCQSVLLHIDY